MYKDSPCFPFFTVLGSAGQGNLSPQCVGLFLPTFTFGSFLLSPTTDLTSTFHRFGGKGFSWPGRLALVAEPRSTGLAGAPPLWAAVTEGGASDAPCLQSARTMRPWLARCAPKALAFATATLAMTQGMNARVGLHEGQGWQPGRLQGAGCWAWASWCGHLRRRSPQPQGWGANSAWRSEA